jgi:urea transporter
MSYWNQARMRATRRKSLWNLLLIPAAIVPWFAGWWLSVGLAGRMYSMMHPDTSFIVLPDTTGGVLIAVGLLCAWCPVAMITGNVLIHALPAARQALDREASKARGTDFRSANRGLIRLSAVLIPLGVGVSCVGLFL